MNKLYKTSIIYLFFIALTTNIFGQTTIEEVVKTFKGVGITNSNIDSELYSLLKDKLNDPKTLNFVFKDTFEQIKKNDILKNLDLKFNNFNVDSISALGITYSYSKQIKTNYFESGGANKSGLDLGLNFDGFVSFNKEYNPNNFLRNTIVFNYFSSAGGVSTSSDEITKEFRELRTKLMEYENLDSLNNSSEWKTFLKDIVSNLDNQVYFQIGLSSSLEANQDFTSKNYVYSANLGLDIKAWNINSPLSQLNIFDWPFAITRWLTGTEDNIYPRGSSLPTFLFNLSYVDPSADSIRKSINETKGYPRFSFEAGFKTLVSNISDNAMYFSADLRYYKELNASQAAKNLNIDQSLYFVAALTHKDGFYVSYAVGKLPLDKKNDEVYSIGFNYNL